MPHLEADDLPRLFRVHVDAAFSSDEERLVQLDVRPEPRLERVDVVRAGQLVAVQREPRFGARGIARCQAAGDQSERRADLEEPVPQPLGVGGGQVDLVAYLLACVSGAGDDHLAVLNDDLAELGALE